jgi:hypothetical protein
MPKQKVSNESEFNEGQSIGSLVDACEVRQIIPGIWIQCINQDI